MSMANSMKNITENITASHRVRVKAMGDLVNNVNESLADARKMVSDNAANRKAMSKEQAADLAQFGSDLADSIGAKLKTFQKELEQMADNRALSATELKDRLRNEAKDLGQSVNRMLADYRKNHAAMTKTQRQNLHGFVENVVNDVADLTATTRGLMTGYRTDIRKAGNLWGNMTRTLANGGDKKAAKPAIRAEEKTSTVKAAARKIHKKKASKK